MGVVRRVPAGDLFVSEPPPEMFGNSPNDAGNEAWTDANWLKSRFHFSFAEYRSRSNQQFSALRVLNDDLVQPARGFGTHGHADMEIVTYIVEGELTHKDSMGTSETLGRGAVQFMTAGTGVRHSEHNLSRDAPLRFIQMWLTPSQSGLDPTYGSHSCAAGARDNAWCALAAGASRPEAPVLIQQDASVSAAELDAGATLPLSVGEGRQCYILQVEGASAVAHGGETVELSRHDAAEVFGPAELVLEGKDGGERTHVLAVDVPYTGQSRYGPL